MQNGGLSSGVAVGYPCEGSECEDGLFCDLGCCVQKCNTDSGQRKNGLCLCTAHEDCFSFNCEGGLCQMQERMHHSEEKEAELRAWHDTLMREEALGEQRGQRPGHAFMSMQRYRSYTRIVASVQGGEG